MSDIRRLRRVFAVLTASCNLTCGYCFQNRKQHRAMGWDTLRSSIDLLLDSEEPELELIFFGGEPLLEFEQIRRATAYALGERQPGQDLSFAVITNGTLLRPATLDFLAAHNFKVQLSFDGVAAAQDVRGRGTFDTLDRALVLLGERYPEYYRQRFKVNLTLLPSTVPHLADSVEYFLDRGVPEICVTPTFTGSSSWNPEDINLLTEQYERMLSLSLREYGRSGQVPVVDFRGTPRRVRPGRISMCGVMKGEEATVDVDGSIHGCTTFAKSFQEFPSPLLRGQLEEMEIGALTDQDLPVRYAKFEERSARARIFHDKQEKYSSYARCGDCIHLAECQVCPMSIGHIPGNRDPNRIPDFPCAYNLVSLKYRDLFQARIGNVERFDPESSPTRDRIRAVAEALRAADRGLLLKESSE